MANRGTETLKEKEIHRLSKEVHKLKKEVEKKDREIEKLNKIIKEIPIMYTHRIIKPMSEEDESKDKTEEAAKAVIKISGS